MNRVAALCLLAACLLASLGAAQGPIRVGLAFDAGGKNDRSFNQSAFEGAQRAAKEFGVELKDFEPADPSQVGQGVRNFASSGFDLIVGVGFGNEAPVTAAARDFPDAKFAVLDAVPRGENTAGLVFRSQEGSYLVGYLAGRTTRTNVVAALGALDIPLINQFFAGYAAGVKAACPSCTVLRSYIGTTFAAFTDPAKAKEIAANLVGRGADVIFAGAGASALGAIDHIKATKCIKAASGSSGVRIRPASAAFGRVPKPRDYTARCSSADAPVYFVGVDANQNYLGDTDNNSATLNHGLTSMLKRVDVAVYETIRSVAQNRPWRAGAREFGLASGGVGYAVDAYNRALIEPATLARLEELKAGIVAGRIKVPTAFQ